MGEGLPRASFVATPMIKISDKVHLQRRHAQACCCIPILPLYSAAVQNNIRSVLSLNHFGNSHLDLHVYEYRIWNEWAYARRKIHTFFENLEHPMPEY